MTGPDDLEMNTLQLAIRTASNGLERYSTNPAARAVVTAIPFVASFDALAGTAGANIALDRLRDLVDNLRQRIESMEETRRDANVTTEQLLDAAIRAVRGVLETGDRAKIRMIASLLVGSMSTERPGQLDAESALSSLISLTPADLQFARDLIEAQRPNRYAYIDQVVPPPNAPDQQFRLLRLQGAGLLEAEAQAGLGAGPRLQFRVTPTFWRILELLEAGGEEMFGVPTG